MTAAHTHLSEGYGGNVQLMKIKKFGSTEANIYEIVRPIAEENGLIVWDVRFEKEGAMWYLRVFLDHMERPVNISDCEAVTRPLNKLLDETDPIPQTYTLEVGSAGLERELIRDRAETAQFLRVVPQRFAEQLADCFIGRFKARDFCRCGTWVDH